MNIFDTGGPTPYHCAPMLNTPSRNRLPRQIDPRKFAQQGIEINGSVPLVDLPRVCEVLASDEGDIQVNLVFGLDEQRLLNVVGDIRADVQPICQRCLEPMSTSLQCQLKLGIVWDEEKAENLPRAYDPWIIGEGQTDIYQVVEDELLLSLPIVSYHDYDCVPKEHFSSGEEVSAEAIEKEKQEKNPFQVLAQLKGALPTSTDKE